MGAVAPRGTATDMFHAVAPNYMLSSENLSAAEIENVSWVKCVERLAAHASPLVRCGYPVDIANVVRFLANKVGEWVSSKTMQDNLRWWWSLGSALYLQQTVFQIDCVATLWSLWLGALRRNRNNRRELIPYAVDIGAIINEPIRTRAFNLFFLLFAHRPHFYCASTA